MPKSSVEIRDETGSVYYPKTTAANVAMPDGTSLELKLTQTEGKVLDFDVLANSKGVSVATAKTSGGYTETITRTSTAKKAAVRTTTKLSNGFREVVTFYEENGTTVKETRTKTTTKTINGFSEVIT